MYKCFVYKNYCSDNVKLILNDNYTNYFVLNFVY